MTELAQQKCQPYQSGSSPITAEEITALQAKIPDWNLLEYEGIPRLQKLYKFANFQGAIAFTNAVGEAAEKEGHHPALLTEWGKVTVSWWTHDVGDYIKMISSWLPVPMIFIANKMLNRRHESSLGFPV
ncbi:Pterin-4-alpha-carbinolamine dehydratase [Microcystis panniformis FACHB-1757]|uniref:4a-hydroxytetrahydrobiopterin dehydratase n=1 Tax=Microcystis panniformis FACHB-1757 TaxID=1638788 RepID=A0A0K1S1I4_9CHRO|nr:Pterin-4-alpha-carbinolamine dehydratase [Microcystis panniformis FACHB-1757]